MGFTVKGHPFSDADLREIWTRIKDGKITKAAVIDALAWHDVPQGIHDDAARRILRHGFPGVDLIYDDTIGRYRVVSDEGLAPSDADQIIDGSWSREEEAEPEVQRRECESDDDDEAFEATRDTHRSDELRQAQFGHPSSTDGPCSGDDPEPDTEEESPEIRTSFDGHRIMSSRTSPEIRTYFDGDGTMSGHVRPDMSKSGVDPDRQPHPGLRYWIMTLIATCVCVGAVGAVVAMNALFAQAIAEQPMQAAILTTGLVAMDLMRPLLMMAVPGALSEGRRIKAALLILMIAALSPVSVTCSYTTIAAALKAGEHEIADAGAAKARESEQYQRLTAEHARLSRLSVQQWSEWKAECGTGGCGPRSDRLKADAEATERRLGETAPTA